MQTKNEDLVSAIQRNCPGLTERDYARRARRTVALAQSRGIRRFVEEAEHRHGAKILVVFDDGTEFTVSPAGEMQLSH